MGRSRRPWSKLALSAFLIAIFATSSMAAAAQSGPAQKQSSPTPVTEGTDNIQDVRAELFELLALNPKLATVIAADPSLLSDEAYVSRNNPGLADFLRRHPEVVREPELYLFLPGQEVRTRVHVPGFGGPANDGQKEGRIVVLLLFALVLAALLWVFRLVLENNKWNRLSKMQNELYSKWLDKCSTNEELLVFFRTGAGKPFFDLAAREPGTASPLSRVFLPLQFGIVLTVTGAGMLSFPYAHAGDVQVFLALGTLLFALGIGLIISAAVSYLLARHLGLLPRPGKAKETSASASANG